MQEISSKVAIKSYVGRPRLVVVIQKLRTEVNTFYVGQPRRCAVMQKVSTTVEIASYVGQPVLGVVMQEIKS